MMGEPNEAVLSGISDTSPIATPMKIGAAVVAGLRLVTLVVSSYLLIRADANDLIEVGFGGDASLFRTLMIGATWVASGVSVAHIVALRAGSTRRIVITALLSIGSAILFAVVRGWGLKGLFQPLEVATLFASLFILRMVVAARED